MEGKGKGEKGKKRGKREKREEGTGTVVISPEEGWEEREQAGQEVGDPLASAEVGVGSGGSLYLRGTGYPGDRKCQQNNNIRDLNLMLLIHLRASLFSVFNAIS